jgi:hypothetical protein
MHAIGQSAALRVLFATVYAARRPARVAVLGCSTGGDLHLVDDTVTRQTVGVDLNSDYLALAGRRLAQRLGAVDSCLRLVNGDVLQVELPDGEFDLIHAPLLLEYVEPCALFARISGWLAPAGTCSVVTQEPSHTLPAVSHTGYASLRVLSDYMVVRSAADVASLARGAGLRLLTQDTVKLPSGKRLVRSCFAKANAG